MKDRGVLLHVLDYKEMEKAVGNRGGEYLVTCIYMFIGGGWIISAAAAPPALTGAWA